MAERPIEKLDIAGLHFRAAVQMMASGCNPFSIHLTAMACRELLIAVAKHRGVALPLDASKYVRPEYRKEWDRAAVKVYNFLKHGDRDPNDTLPAGDLSRIEGWNDLEMVSNALHLHALGHVLPTVYNGLVPLIGLLYPGIMDWDGMEHDHPELTVTRRGIAGPDRTTAMKALMHMLRQAGELPN